MTGRMVADNPLNDEYLQIIDDPKPQSFIARFYVSPDLQVIGSLELHFFDSFEEAYSDYASLPSDKLKALGIQNSNRLPGSLDFIQCRDGEDVLVEDYKAVKGWDNPEIACLISCGFAGI